MWMEGLVSCNAVRQIGVIRLEIAQIKQKWGMKSYTNALSGTPCRRLPLTGRDKMR